MASMRVHELAKEFDMSSGDLLDRLKEMKIPAKSHASMLNDAYVDKIRKNLEPEIRARAGALEAEEAAAPAAPTVSEVYESFLQELGAEKARISDEEVRARVEKLERHTRQIAAWLKQHPGKEAGVRRFSGYYLPTVLKLLRTYNEVALHAGESSVASGIQQEIGGILDTIDRAFVTLHDGLLQDTALNVSAEISALETVLAQDGLVQDGLAGQ